MILERGVGEKYRWAYPGLAFIIGMTVYITSTWSLFYPHIMRHFGLANVAPVALAASFINLGAMVLGPPISGILFDRYGPKIPLALSGLVYFAGMFILSLIFNFGEWSAAQYYWYLGSLIVGLGVGLYGGVYPSTMARWFPDRYGTATGIAVAGSGLATFVMTPVFSYLIVNFGFAKTFLIPGIIGLFIIFLLGVILWKVPDSDWRPTGWQPKTEAGKQVKENYSLREAVRDIRFWLLYVCFFCSAFASMFFMQNASTIIVEGLATRGGMDEEYIVASIVPAFITVTGLFTALGRFAWGGIMDRIGGPWRTLPVVYLTSAVMIGFFYLGYTNLIWIIVAGVILYFTLGGEPTVHYASVPYIFGRRHIGTVMTILNASSVGLGMVLGPFMGAFIRDLTGGYLWSLILAIVLRVIAGLVALYGLKITTKQALA